MLHTFSVVGIKMQQQKCVPAQCNKIHQLEECIFCSLLKCNKMQQQKCVPAQCSKIHHLEQCFCCCILLPSTRCNKRSMCACSMQQDPPARTMLLLFSVEGNKMQQQKCVPAQCNKIHHLEQCLFCSLLKATRCNKRSMCS